MLKSWGPGDFWEAYKKLVYNEPIQPEQENECWNAFFAGMHAAWEFQIELSLQLTEEEAMEALNRFHSRLVFEAKLNNPTGES